MSRPNPFKNKKFQGDSRQTPAKEKAKDPLDVRELLTDATCRAVITPEGELKVHKSNAPAPAVELMKERYWGGDPGRCDYQTLRKQRIALESREMERRFPGFRLHRVEQNYCEHGWTIAKPGEDFWSGKLLTHAGSSYIAVAVYPVDYPFGEIRSYVLHPHIPATEHRFQDGHLCLYDHQGNGAGYEREISTAVTIIAWTSAWLHAYEIWRATGQWPTLEDKA